MGTSLWIQPEELGAYADTEFAQEAAETASYLMWAMSGRKYTGEVTVTVKTGKSDTTEKPEESV